MASCLILQHVAPEPATGITDAFERAGIDADVRLLYRGAPVPGDAAAFDGVVAMGGPMSVTSDDGFPTRRAELNLLADAVARGRPVLGVCLGAQLLAASQGGTVRRGEAGPEIGWAPVELDAAASEDPLLHDLPASLTVLHWHGDTYTLPPDGVRLASSSRYVEQAFRVGDRAWGFQFHLEVDAHAVRRFLDAFGSEVADAGTTVDDLAADSPAALHALAPVATTVLDRFAALVASFAHELVADAP